MSPLSLLWFALSAGAQAADDPAALAARAVQENPGVEALGAQAAALEAQVEGAAVWPDPVLSAELSNLPLPSLRPSDHPMSGMQLRVQQPIPAPGVRAGREEVVEAQQDQAEAAQALAELSLRREVHEAYWALAQVRGLRALTEEQLLRLGELEAAVSASYAAGEVGQSAPLRLILLREQLRDELGDFDQAERALLAALERGVGGELGAVETPDEVELIEVTESVDAWVARAEAAHPALSGLSAQRAQAEAEAGLAQALGRPDLSVVAGYRVRTIETASDPGADMVSLGVAAPIPLGSRQAAQAEQAAATQRGGAAEAAWRAERDRLEAELEAAHAAWTRAAEKVHATEVHLLPAARELRAATLSDFRVGRAELSALYEAELQLLSLERSRLRAAVATHQQAAAVAALTGEIPGGAP